MSDPTRRAFLTAAARTAVAVVAATTPVAALAATAAPAFDPAAWYARAAAAGVAPQLWIGVQNGNDYSGYSMITPIKGGDVAEALCHELRPDPEVAEANTRALFAYMKATFRYVSSDWRADRLAEGWTREDFEAWLQVQRRYAKAQLAEWEAGRRRSERARHAARCRWAKVREVRHA